MFLGVAALAVVPATRSALSLPDVGSLFASARPDLILHKVHPEYLAVTVVERGTLESAENRDVICKVKAGSKGTYASTIKWVIDDGSMVKKGQLLMELDDSLIQDNYRTQAIAVEKAKADWMKSDEDYVIQTKANEADVAAKLAALQVAELDFDKFLGIRVDPALNPVGSLAGSPVTLVERGEYQSNLDQVTGDLKSAESDLEAFRDRASWAERSVRFGYLTPSQAKSEQSKMESGEDKVSQLQKKKYVMETFQKQRDLTNLRSAVDVARINLEQATKQATAKLNQAEATRRTNYSVYQQELDKLREMEEQIRECRIHAPQDGMVVYYKDGASRWSNNQDGVIQQGNQVKEGQKLIRIPDLNRMQVNTKVHEAMVSRIRADVRQTTGFLEALKAGLLTTPSAFARLVNDSEQAVGILREAYHHEENVLVSQGQKAQVRVDAYPDRLLPGHVRMVAAVASQQDWMTSDVKVYQTLVTIDEAVEGLKPDMSAEVTILVDPPTDPVLCVPLQAVVGGAEGGAKRKVFVMTPAGPQEKEVTLGLFNEKMVEVKEGLADGDMVVLNPKVLLGDKAKTRDESAEPGAGRRGPGEKGKGGPPGGKGGAGGKAPPAGGGGSRKS